LDFFLAPADLASVNHHIVLVSGTVDQNRTKGKLLEAHPFSTSVALSGPSVAAQARCAL
jgi:hypothetical protein